MKNMKKHFTILTLALLLVVGTESAQAAFSEPGVSFPNLPGSFVYPLTAPVSVSEGGTGRTSLTANRLLVGNGTGQVSFTPAPTAGYLSWNGSAFVWDTPAGSIGGTGSSGRVPFFSNASTLANSPIQTDGNSAEIPNNSFNALSLCIDWVCKSSWPTSVTSVGLSAPSIFNVSGSPVTGSGSLALNLASQAANRVFAGPASGANADPTFRALVAADIPNLAASKITSGVLAAARLGNGPASASTYLRGDGTWSSLPSGTAASWATLTDIPAGFVDNVDNDSGGDVTAVNAGSNLTGGGLAGNLTLGVVSSPTFTGRITAADGFTGDASANIGGTGAAAYFPNGLWSNGSSAWIYGSINTNSGIYDTSNRMRLEPSGNSWFNGGNVGIGTSNPLAKLDVEGGESNFSSGTYSDPAPGVVYDAKFGGSNRGIAVRGESLFADNVNFTGSTATGENLVTIGSGSVSGTALFVDGSATIDGGLNLLGNFSINGIGQIDGNNGILNIGSSGGAVVHATGEGSFHGVYGYSVNGVGVYGQSGNTGVLGYGTSYDFRATGPGVNYGADSSIRWKRNIAPIANALDKVGQMRGVTFDWIKEYGGQHDIGFIAEEVGKVLPEIVEYEEDGVYATGMDYSKVTPLLVEAIKELKAENDELRERIEALEAKAR